MINCEPRASRLIGTRNFRDHYFYSDSDVRQLLERRKRSGATDFLTTEKDAINLGTHLDTLQPLPIVPVKLRLEDAARRGRRTPHDDSRAQSPACMRQSKS